MIEPVTAEELDSAHPMEEVRPWVESLCARYKSPEWHDHFVAKRGLSNRIQGELVPLAHFSHHVAPERRGSQLKYFPTTTQSYDAQVLSQDGSVQEVLEVTLACDGYRDAIASCLVPCDHVPVRSWPLFRAREIMPALIESIKQGKKS
jgi:hypothetical protein